LEEVLTFSLQKLEAMAMDALAVQAEMADDDVSFEVVAAVGDVDVFNALMPTDECSESGGSAGRARWALGGGHLKDRYGKPERGECMGADKNSSRRRWKLQQDERDFQHTSPTHYPSWPSPRSHWSATGPRNHHTTFRPESTDQHRSKGEHHTGQTGQSLKAPKAPNRPTDLQTDPNSKQPQHRTTTNTPRRSPEQKPTEVCTGQTGQEHRSDRSRAPVRPV
jgi:hypothetical protein